MKGSTKVTRGPVKRAVTRNGVRKPKGRKRIKAPSALLLALPQRPTSTRRRRRLDPPPLL